MKKITTITLSFFAITALLFTACTKEKNNNNNPSAVDSGKIYFHLHTNVGDNEVENYDEVYTTSGGRKISLDLAQFYISAIQLVKTDGTIYDITGAILLKTFEEEDYVVANVPVGTYRSVKFKIGLDATTNTKDASWNDLLDHAEMWFGSAAQPDGYVFLNAHGKIDTTTNANGTEAQMQVFNYKIGTNQHYVQVALPDHATNYTVAKGSIETVHLIFDFAILFNGIQLNNPSNLSISTTADNSSALSNTISNNIASGFSYEE